MISKLMLSLCKLFHHKMFCKIVLEGEKTFKAKNYEGFGTIYIYIHKLCKSQPQTHTNN
jgi:hypothetical protein